MRIVAVYNMKGGVGKTTTAVNLSYLAGAAGYRTLLWDLDPQAASSFAFRIRPHVAGFDRKTVKNGRAFAGAIKATDYDNLDLLPADFAYRKLDRMLSDLDKPKRALRLLLQTLGRDYDIVILDCPAGFSLVIEGVFAAADHVLVPTIPTTLSLRTLARLLKCAERADSTARVSAFFSMADSRKALHRRTCERSTEYEELFLTGQIPYASIVEQMAVRRMPLPVLAPRDPATAAFAHVWGELLARLEPRPGAAGCLWDRPSALLPRSTREADRWPRMIEAVESLIATLDAAETTSGVAREPLAAAAEVAFIHAFDTEGRDLERSGRILQLREQSGAFFLIAGSIEADADGARGRDTAQVQIDNFWARQILSGTLSPIVALEQRLGRAAPVEAIRAVVAKRPLARIHSRVGGTALLGCP